MQITFQIIEITELSISFEVDSFFCSVFFFFFMEYLCDWRVYINPECPGYTFYYDAYLFGLVVISISLAIVLFLIPFRVRFFSFFLGGGFL